MRSVDSSGRPHPERHPASRGLKSCGLSGATTRPRCREPRRSSGTCSSCRWTTTCDPRVLSIPPSSEPLMQSISQLPGRSVKTWPGSSPTTIGWRGPLWPRESRSSRPGEDDRRPARENEPMRILVTETLSERGLALLRKDFDVDVRDDLAKGGLAGAIGPYDALVVRSQTQVTAEVVDAAENLKVIARAGIGLDNVDVESATRRGVMVVNAPQSNILSAAEHTMALLLSQSRLIPQAARCVKRGECARSRFQGVELAGKTIGVIGLGRVGAMVATRAAAFGMRLIAFDPYVPKERAKEMGIELMPSLEALLVQADFITVHLPRTPDTEGLIGERELALVKEGARLVNTAGGGIVDEQALAKAVEDGKLAGAALDVFAVEPTTESPLFG